MINNGYIQVNKEQPKPKEETLNYTRLDLDTKITWTLKISKD